jgi:hypothetical protein
MKTLWLILVLAISRSNILADATIQLNNHDPDLPILFAQNDFYQKTVYVELLGDEKLVSEFIATDGYFDNGIGVVPGVVDYAMVNFTLRVWTQGAKYPGYSLSGSASWVQPTGSWDPNSGPLSSATGPPLMIPQPVILGTIPESSTMVLGLQGLAAILFYRRKIKKPE